MVGNEVVVELKNDSEVRGVVEESDKMMNIHLSTVVETKPDGTYRELESYRVSGFSVRYVHLPRFIKTHSLVSDHARRLDRITKSSRPHTIKDRAKSQVSLREPREEIILEPMDYDGEK